jgi:hypothetical protein
VSTTAFQKKKEERKESVIALDDAKHTTPMTKIKFFPLRRS